MAPRTASVHSNVSNGSRQRRPSKDAKSVMASFRLRYILLAIVCGWVAFHYWTVQRPDLAALNAKHQQLQTQMASLTAKKVQLTQQVQQLNDPAYIAQYASQHYNLILPGQVSFDFSH